MKIGELAKQTGVSVRTLHHYDEIGLLKPSQRTESGHRLYGKGDVVRLHRIVAFRRLGLSLEEVGKVIGESTNSLKEIFGRHVDYLMGEIEEKQGTLRMLKGALDYLETDEVVDIGELVEMIKQFSLHEKYFSKSQLEDLEKRERAIGKEAILAVQQEWPQLIEKVREHMANQTDPEAPEVQTLAKRWIELKEMFSGGDKKLEENTRKLYEENPEVGKKYGVDNEIFEYVQRSADSLKK